jgi:hypothetical protein
MKKAGIIIAAIIALSALAPILFAGSAQGVIVWSEIMDTEMQKNPNFWRAELDFNITVDEVDAIAFRFETNETPPSNNATVWLKDGNGTNIIFKEPIIITEDILNGTWHIEYLNETVQVVKGHNYTFRLWIKANTLDIDYERVVSISEFLFKLGFGQDTAPETPGSGKISTANSDVDNKEPQANETSNWPSLDEICCTTAKIVGAVVFVGLIMVVKYEK